MQEFGRAVRVNGADAARRPHEHVLDIAKWPEQEQVWDLAKWDEANPREFQVRAVPAAAPEPESVFGNDILKIESAADLAHTVESSLRLFPAEGEETGDNTGRIVAGLAAALLLIVGGICAYQMSSAKVPVTSLAMQAPAQINMPAPQAVPSSRQPVPASGPPPLRSTSAPSKASDGVSAPPRRSAYSTPNKPVPQWATLAPDDPINAPMTLTPETAPPPQQPVTPN